MEPRGPTPSLRVGAAAEALEHELGRPVPDRAARGARVPRGCVEGETDACELSLFVVPQTIETLHEHVPRRSLNLEQGGLRLIVVATDPARVHGPGEAGNVALHETRELLTEDGVRIAHVGGQTEDPRQRQSPLS